MQRKGSGTSSAIASAVNSTEVRSALGRAKGVSQEEERVLRMRHGAKVDLGAPLQRVGQENPELADELLVMEMELIRELRARQHAPAPTPSRTKDKIVRALRKKR